MNSNEWGGGEEDREPGSLKWCSLNERMFIKYKEEQELTANKMFHHAVTLTLSQDAFAHEVI